MSSIVWDISAEAATVAVDTLCTDGHGKPVGLSSKAFIVPHLKLVIATTGNLQILEDYFLVLNSKPIGGPSDLVLKAPEILRNVSGVDPLRPDGSQLTTSIFQFGFSEESGEMEGFMFHTGSGFSAVKLEYGTSYKPPCPLRGDHEPTTKGWMVQVMAGQRYHQELLLFESRVHIGGEILMFRLEKGSISVEELCPFKDREEVAESIFGKP